ncbi:hemerythrin domain-containing protein [Streptomyces sp. 7-21]|jgi:hemerythrin superfamily protein|uniref:hemerythrin domain-containing protein n=1 Tax=Streptomyces sp. 7-21 TaxID=2802283 RepID=UPI00191CEE35|nr:hemerythrin domain-containing protein [Streptomyces sp. 7-21]MBL1066608.1 hemerythrin domain-containing protein [Streptomyces sp. 7-21]
MAQTHGGAMDTDDVVVLLKQQHQQIKSLFARVESGTGDERRGAFRDLVRLLAVHETAEEEVVHPAARKAFEGGEQVVGDRLREEREAKELLRDLDRMDPDDPDFMPKLRSLRQAVLAHAEAEEQYEFPQLNEHTDPARLARMAKAVRAAEAAAPTHPHPGMESRAANLAAGPFAAVADRVRDALGRS